MDPVFPGKKMGGDKPGIPYGVGAKKYPGEGHQAERHHHLEKLQPGSDGGAGESRGQWGDGLGNDQVEPCRKPQMTKVQLAPCHSPLITKVIIRLA